MNMRSIVCGVGLLVGACGLFAQTPKLEFEVASVKTAEPMTMGRFRIGMRVDEGRLAYENVTLRDCIRTAYRLKDYQISTPDWMASTRFDIIAKLPEGATKDQVPEMLQALLAERFHMVVHHESKAHDSYVLGVAKGGPKLTAAAPDDPSSEPSRTVMFGAGGDGGGRSEAHTVTAGGGGGGGGAMGMSVTKGPVNGSTGMKMQLRKQTLDGFAQFLERFLGSPVVNQTEIQGIYDFAVEMSLDDMSHGAGVVIMKGPGMGGDGGSPAGNTEASEPGGGLFRSVQSYGLKLDRKKSPSMSW